MSEKGKSKVIVQAKHVPKDAQVIMTILKEVGITDYEPRVVNLLLDFTYRYVTSVLDDARVFATHSKKKTIDLEDVRLAVQMQLDKSFTSPPPREVLLEITREKNFNPLPMIRTDCGLRLPPDRYCLSSCNYRLKSNLKKAAPKPTISAAESLMTVRTFIPPPPQNVVVRRPPGAIVIVGAPKSNYRLNDGVKKAAPKPTTSAVPTMETVTTSKPPPGLEVASRLAPQNVAVNRPPGAIVNVAAPKPTVIPKSILKFTFGTKVVAKPAVRVTAGPSAHTPVKMELDEQVTQKRKREDGDDDSDK